MDSEKRKTRSRILHDLLIQTIFPWDIIKLIYHFVYGCYFFGTWRSDDAVRYEVTYGKMNIYDRKWIELPVGFTSTRQDGWNFYLDHDYLWMHHVRYLVDGYVSEIIRWDDTINQLVRIDYRPENIYNYSFVTTENDLIFLIGGLYSDSVVLNRERNVFESYRVSTKTWSILPSMSTPRYDAAAVVWNNNKIYVLGGMKNFGVILSSCECYDTEKNKWVSIKDMPAPRYDAKAIIWNEVDPCLVLMGGRMNIGGETDTVLFYHLSSNSWSVADWKLPQPLTVDFNHFYTQLFFSENVLVVGCSYHPYRGCWMFHINTKQWIQIHKNEEK